jgi:hypothetical protein
VFAGVFIAEVDGVADKESGDTTTVDVQTLLEAFLNMSLMSSCFTGESFLWYKTNYRSWGCLQVMDYQDFQIVGHQIKGILL